MKQLLIIIALICFLPLLAQETVTTTYYLGQSQVNIQLVKYGKKESGIVFVNLHENESTGIAATQQYLQKRNGYFISINQNRERYISFEYDGKNYRFDPNRMFTKTGRIADLKLLNKQYTDDAEEIVEEFSNKIIAHIKNAKIVIAVHNNIDGKPLSVNSYRNRYVNRKMDADDFILTTEESIFRKLKAKKINTVLETTSTSTDDGSLSWYCSQKNIPYINVEAQAGHRSEQLRMLNALTSIITNYTN